VAPGGTVVALVGRSGAGKTTVTDLVARFHDPSKGRIVVNGLDIRDIRLKSYRGLLAIVPQEVFLFDGSVRDNIAYGRHDATAAEVEDAARISTKLLSVSAESNCPAASVSGWPLRARFLRRRKF
jgi:ATP-binding cassette, subfamily B, bacterial